MKSVMAHSFSNVPQADIPRSNFNRTEGHKTTFNAGKLVPIYAEEVYPGDTLNMRAHGFIRMSTPIYPIMDNLFCDVHWFWVPNRLSWENWRKFMGEQEDPSDSTDFTVPVRSITTAVGEDTFEDHLGIPYGNPVDYNALYVRAYCRIYNEWYRDQNLVDSNAIGLDTDDSGGSSATGQVLLNRGKRHDYFTSCLPWLYKGETTSAPIDVVAAGTTLLDRQARFWNETEGAAHAIQVDASSDNVSQDNVTPPVADSTLYWAEEAGDTVYGLEATTTINELRQAFQIQRLLERDARSGTRYSEIVKSHFGVDFFDVTYRPEYLGGGSAPINIHSVPSTAGTGTGAEIGDLGAFATASPSSGFVKSFTEHGIVMGIASVRADLTYQQGLERKFSRSTRYDYYFPVLAHLGEQAVLNKEIYYQNTAADDNVFGYQERWSELRYAKSKITGKFRSDATGTLDAWHLSQEFSSLPTLDAFFIAEAPPMDRVLQVASEPDFIADFHFNAQWARPMPVYSVPGLVDHL